MLQGDQSKQNESTPNPQPELEMITPAVYINRNKILGHGSTGTINEGVHHHPQPHPVAIKVIPLAQVNNQVVGYLLQCELEALKMTSKNYCPDKNWPAGPPIVQLEEILVVDGHCYIVTELLGDTLKHYLDTKKKLPENESISILKNILQGYDALKQHGIIHRDLKPDNILFSRRQDGGTERESAREGEGEGIKIIDFGYCEVQKLQTKKPKAFYNVGSPRYMSPEAYMRNDYSQKSDIWAIGIMFYEMLTGTNLDKGIDITQSFKQLQVRGIPIPSDLGMQSRAVLQGMLMYDKNKRASCDDILRRIYLQGLKKQNIRQRSNCREISPKSNLEGFMGELKTGLISQTPTTRHGEQTIRQMDSVKYFRNSTGAVSQPNQCFRLKSFQLRSGTSEVPIKSKGSPCSDLRARCMLSKYTNSPRKGTETKPAYPVTVFRGNAQAQYKELQNIKGVQMPKPKFNNTVSLHQHAGNVGHESVAAKNMQNSCSQNNLINSLQVMPHSACQETSANQKRVNIMFRSVDIFNTLGHKIYTDENRYHVIPNTSTHADQAQSIQDHANKRELNPKEGNVETGRQRVVDKVIKAQGHGSSQQILFNGHKMFVKADTHPTASQYQHSEPLYGKFQERGAQKNMVNSIYYNPQELRQPDFRFKHFIDK